MTILRFRLCHLSPRIDDLAAYAAGVLSIQRYAIPQVLFIHPDDYASLPAAVHNSETH